jgi:hypothetical protein
MYFHGARFSNYEAWLSDPIHIKPSAQVVWPVVGQEILNGDVGGGFQGIQITSGFFQLWRASGITSELQLYTTAIGGLVMAAAMFFAGWFHYHKAAPKLEWFQNVESMLNHHLAGLLGLGSLAWAGHQIHVSLPVNKLLDAGVDPKEIPLPHDFLLNRALMADLYPSFAKGLAPFFTLQWGEYSDFLTFKGGLNPVTGGLWLSDTAHHHVAIAVLFLIAGHMYRTNWGIGHSMKEILEAHKGPFTGEGHVGLYEILTTSWHAQLAINLALFGSLSIIVACFLWVTFFSTICWDTPKLVIQHYFFTFEKMPQVLVPTFLSVLVILLTSLLFLAKRNLELPGIGKLNILNFEKNKTVFGICLNGLRTCYQQTLTKMVSDILKVEQWNNLVGRSNQQETEENFFFSGSSETLRGTFIFLKKENKTIYDFSKFLLLSREQKKVNSRSKIEFLEWFLGFTEGDGSFGIRDGRLVFIINQAEIEILQKIRSELGFGNVSTFNQNGRVYARYSVTNKKGIYFLIILFNGNIHLQKVHDRFSRWVQHYNQTLASSENDKILVKPRRLPKEISLENAWLSGFFDAEGGFYAGMSKEDKATKRNFRLRLKAYIDQKNEFDILQQIAFLFDVKNVTTRSIEKKTYRVDCNTKKALEKILNYFEHSNLRSKKHIVYALWKKVAYSYLNDSYKQDYEKIQKRIQRIQLQNKVFKEQKTVLPN